MKTGRLVALASALMFFYGFILGGQQLVMVDITGEYGGGTSGIGFLVALQHVASMAMPVCMGTVADRVGKKKILVLFSVIFGMGCLVAGLSGTMLVYMVGTLLIGAGYSVCESLSSAVLTDLDEENGMRYVNIAQCLLSVGAIISPVLLRFCMNRLGADWRLGFYICAVMFCVLAVLLAMTVFPLKSAAASVKAAKRPKEKKDSYTSLQMIVLFSLVASIIMYVGLENGFGYFVNSLFTGHLKNADFGAMGLSAYWAGMALIRFLCGLRAYNPERMLFVCFTLCVVFFVLLALSSTPLVSVVFCGCLGAAFGPIWSTLVSLAAKVRPENSAGAIGLMSTGCGFGGIIFPALLGIISEAFSIQMAFVCLAVIAFLGLVLSTVAAAVRRKQKQ